MTPDNEMTTIDMADWQPDKSYRECMALAEKLKLVETRQHGDHHYVRITQRGINILCALTEVVALATDPDTEALKMS